MTMEAKKAAAEKAVERVRDGMTVGLGSGSTAEFAIRKLADLVKRGLSILAVASSVKSETLASELGITVLNPSETPVIDIAFDGADETDARGNLVKGGGGSLLREKILAYASQRFYVMIDESKVKKQLGAFPLPVEIVPFASGLALNHLRASNCDPVIRQSETARPFVTDNGNYIADCRFGEIEDMATLDVRLKMIPGVVETGFFPAGVVTSIFVGYANGDVREIAVNP